MTGRTTIQGAERVDSASHPAARRVRDVLRSTGRPRTIVIDDEENIDRALRCGVPIDSLYFAEGSPPRSSLLAEREGVQAFALAGSITRDLFGDGKRARVFALARAPRPARLSRLRGGSGDLVVLDGVRLMGNIGAIIRTAHALGADGAVLLDSGLRSVFDRRLIRASRGLVFSLPVVLCTPEEFSGFVREEGLPLAVLDSRQGRPPDALRPVPGRIGLVLGSERSGHSAQLDELAELRCSIPMRPGVDSLNVSVAAAIALFARLARPGS
ncbi:TrmH family RNA methyltransferase [Gulosibacter sp. 10]|uniref:TrmH family RNA methyltransferase n=1 Tax=Gulosibacter sp. 10 TaxID=1255570 RepID=UPI00097F4218|nr:TrmH family RNA methyltransferase [Gulosibacter sp. 10]SJM68217.1 rRNA methylase [Gulosibacter sp. 10]